jgi:hypothetical protein
MTYESNKVLGPGDLIVLSFTGCKNPVSPTARSALFYVTTTDEQGFKVD